MQVFKNLLFMPLFAATLLCCKNQPVNPENKPATETATEMPAVPRDSVVGFKGADHATFTPQTANSGEFEYQQYTVNVTDLTPQAGQRVTVFFKEGKAPFTLPDMTAPSYFSGICRDRLFMDSGTGPDGREMVMFNLKTMKPVLRTQYVGEPEIMPNGKLWYMRPAQESEITKMPECPDKAEWEKNGLRVGYGQVCNYDLTRDVEVKKNEWRCISMQ